jgi:crotonobetainyl-CoA:carnitine CoA-transferase CaiB-like acyl-CoA transferase
MTLAGVRVLDLGLRGSTAWASRLLADYGAEVIAVEPSAGHPLRRDSLHAAWYFLSGKRIVNGPDLEELIRPAQVILTDTLPGDVLDAAALQAGNPRAIVCALTAYGQTGVRAQDQGNELTVNALSGWASVNGYQGREPLKASGYQVACQAGTFAFGCILAALIEQAASGAQGQVIDIAELEVLVSTFSPAPLRYQYSGFVWPRKQPLDVNDGPVPVADGYFALTISRPAFWIKAMRILGLPDLADDEELQQAGLRPKLKDRFVARMSEAMAGWKRMDLFDALAAERVIAGPVLTMDELGSAAVGTRLFPAQRPGNPLPGPLRPHGQIRLAGAGAARKRWWEAGWFRVPGRACDRCPAFGRQHRYRSTVRIPRSGADSGLGGYLRHRAAGAAGCRGHSARGPQAAG